MRTIGSPLSRWARRRSAHGEEGFTLLEMVVTMAILAVVVALTSGLIIGFSQQTADVNDSIQGVQEAREAAVSFIGYLRGATGLLAMTPSTATSPVSPSTSTSATTLTMTVATGFNSSTMSSNSTVVCAQWQPPVGNQDAKFEVSFNCGQATQRTIETYFALGSQTAPVFTYYKYSNGALTKLTTTNPVPACVFSEGEIAAVGVHITFLAGPQVPKVGFYADLPTTLDTTVFLRGDALATTTSSSSTTTTSTACPE